MNILPVFSPSMFYHGLLDGLNDILIESGYSRVYADKMITQGHWRLWIIEIKEAVLGSFITETNSLGLTVVVLTGSAKDLWIGSLQDWLKALARANGHSRVYMWGRPGWQKDAKKYGWHVSRILCETEA